MPMPSSFTELIFLLALFLPVLVAAFLVKVLIERRQHSGNHKVKTWTVVMVLALLWNPFAQAIILEPLDSMWGVAMSNRASAAGIIGMDETQVRSLLGEPSKVRYYSNVLTWEYKQIPGYWFGSYFQVFFRSGVVYGIEANDD